MRAYRTSDEEAVHARDLLKDWKDEGFLTAAQYQQMEQDAACDLRRTNIFLRLVLFFFTLIIVLATVGLFFVVLFSGPETRATGIFLLIFAAISYAATEFAVSKARLYRYGIEEALAVCSVVLLYTGIQFAFVNSQPYSPTQNRPEYLVPAAGAIASIWIWLRFGLPYAPLAAMFFVPYLAADWTSSQPARHIVVAAIYTAALFTVAAIRRPHRFTYLNQQYSSAEALLWLGIYLAINLQFSSPDLLEVWWYGAVNTAEFSRPFYWTTWVLTWCLPPIVIARGLREKDRCVIAVGAIVTILTLVTNKPYLGWQRNTWDPMLLGALLIGVALFLRRWLAQGPDQVRRGFTARRLSGKDKTWINAGATAIGLASPTILAPSPQTSSPDVHFGGGKSGGGGASSDF